MNVEAIDAGARAIYAHEPLTWGNPSDTYETITTADRASLRAIAATAIEAADAARATDLKAHLVQIENSIQEHMIAHELQDRFAYMETKRSWGEARARLFALFGITP